MAVDKEKVFASAQKYAERSQWDKAIRELNRIVDEDSTDCRALLRIADYTQKMGYPGEALQIFVSVADKYRQEGSAQKALAVLKQAQKLGVADKKLSPMLAELYYSIGMTHEAMGYYRQSLEYYDELGNNAQYIQTLQMLIRLEPEDAQWRQLYALRLLEAGDEQGYKRQYELLLSLLLSKERYADYVEAAREFLKQYPKDEGIIKNIANIYVQTAFYKEALELLGLIAHPDRKADVLNLYVKCYEALGNSRQAVESLKDLARLYESEDRDRAMIAQLWMRAQALDPEDPEVNLALLVGPYSEEVPMLGQSAITAIEPEFHPGTSSRLARPVTGSSQIVEMKLEEARSQIEAYRHDRALILCSEALTIQPENLDALQLMLKIHTVRGDKFAAAATQRKLASALWARDKDAAIQSVLAAEKLTPRAIENFNLILNFGLDPANFGLSAPLMRPSSISDAAITAPTKEPGRPAPKGPPPLPKPPPLPNRVSNPLAPQILEQPKALNLAQHDAENTAPPTRRAEVLIHNWERRSAKTIELPPPIRKLPSKILENLRDIEEANRSTPPAEQPAEPESDFFNAFDDSQFDADFDDLLSDLFSEPANAAVTASASNKVAVKTNDLSALPPAYMEKVSESIKEIEFYISIGLLDDAELSLKNLVYDYGDLPAFANLRAQIKTARAT